VEPNRERCAALVHNSTAVITSLVSRLGYVCAQELAMEAKRTGRCVRELVLEHAWLTRNEFEKLVSPEAVNRLGFVPEEP
jgi:aspartate ammonia-lyase